MSRGTEDGGKELGFSKCIWTPTYRKRGVLWQSCIRQYKKTKLFMNNCQVKCLNKRIVLNGRYACFLFLCPNKVQWISQQGIDGKFHAHFQLYMGL